MKTDKNILIVPDYMIMLKAISDKDEQSLNDIHFLTKITYSHLHHIKKLFLEKNWISCTRDGRKFKIRLTDEGESVAETVLILLNKLGVTETNITEFRLKTKHKHIENNVEQEENINDVSLEEETNGGEN